MGVWPKVVAEQVLSSDQTHIAKAENSLYKMLESRSA
jgi:hypothetical protein